MDRDDIVQVEHVEADEMTAMLAAVSALTMPPNIRAQIEGGSDEDLYRGILNSSFVIQNGPQKVINEMVERYGKKERLSVTEAYFMALGVLFVAQHELDRRGQGRAEIETYAREKFATLVAAQRARERMRTHMH